MLVAHLHPVEQSSSVTHAFSQTRATDASKDWLRRPSSLGLLTAPERTKVRETTVRKMALEICIVIQEIAMGVVNASCIAALELDGIDHESRRNLVGTEVLCQTPRNRLRAYWLKPVNGVMTDSFQFGFLHTTVTGMGRLA